MSATSGGDDWLQQQRLVLALTSFLVFLSQDGIFMALKDVGIAVVYVAPTAAHTTL
jgi:hypothetical protein